MDLVLIGNVIGVIAVIENIFIFATLKRKNILKLKFLSDSLWFLNYLFLGALTGAVLNIIAMLRETIFSLRGSKKFASHFFWLPIFLLLTLISPTLDCIKAGAFVPMTLLPAAGSMLTVYSFYQSSPKVTRYIALVAQTLWLIYTAMLLNIPAVCSNVLQIVSALIGITRAYLLTRKNRKGSASPEKNTVDNTD